MRNPYTVFESTRSFFTNTIKPLELQHISDEEMERNILRTYTKLYQAYEEQKKYVPAGNLFEVKFEEFEADAFGTTARAYEPVRPESARMVICRFLPTGSQPPSGETGIIVFRRKPSGPPCCGVRSPSAYLAASTRVLSAEYAEGLRRAYFCFTRKGREMSVAFHCVVEDGLRLGRSGGRTTAASDLICQPFAAVRQTAGWGGPDGGTVIAGVRP